MRTLALLTGLLLLSQFAWAGDYHQDGQAHYVVYSVTNSSGNHVTGETIRLTVKRSADGFVYDFNDSTWKAFSGTTTPHKTMNEDANSGFYFFPFTIDAATNYVTQDYAFTVSNDSATYADLQTEVVNFDNLNNLIKIHR